MNSSKSIIEIRRHHVIGLEQARNAVQAVAEQLRAELRVSHQWQGDSLKFDCPGAHGRIDVMEKEVCVSVSLSWVLMPAKGRIERSICNYLDQYLG